ncbi:DUF427 domain-containing protein [Paenibacillus sp. R14(2021)]|uniref:DUF427 domain-containing protein n=1 Tax=Paenibacillus sp. R14(2021) TaxID=2859228 RepID=UPI001C615921|nr:DUF427 domain-containing protein [Paenibacillus sp. R14(2021)]
MTASDERSTCELPAEGAAWDFRVEPSSRWVRVKFGGETIADSKRVVLAFEKGARPVYYFPQDDVNMQLLIPSHEQYICSHKGTANYWSIQAGGSVVDNAAWSYRTPTPGAKGIEGLLSFYWNRSITWFEEELQVFGHARDPYVRADAIPSSRHVKVVVGGEVIAESSQTVVVFETGLAPRVYLPKEAIRQDVLVASSTTTRCPYKGLASYWSIQIGDKLYKDVLWSYEHPMGAVREITGYVSFYGEKVDALLVDGEPWPQSHSERLVR